MLTLNLTPIFRARGIQKPYSFLVKAGLSPHSANIILSSRTRIFRLDHIELLCNVLNCEPNDLLKWTPENGKIYAENNSLNKLIQAEPETTIQETITSIPYKELKELTKTFNNKEK